MAEKRESVMRCRRAGVSRGYCCATEAEGARQEAYWEWLSTAGFAKGLRFHFPCGGVSVPPIDTFS